MGHPELFSRACDINKARLNNSDVPFYCVEYMFYHTSSSVPCFNFIIIIFSVVCFYSLSVYSYWVRNFDFFFIVLFPPSVCFYFLI